MLVHLQFIHIRTNIDMSNEFNGCTNYAGRINVLNIAVSENRGLLYHSNCRKPTTTTSTTTITIQSTHQTGMLKSSHTWHEDVKQHSMQTPHKIVSFHTGQKTNNILISCIVYSLLFCKITNKSTITINL